MRTGRTVSKLFSFGALFLFAMLLSLASTKANAGYYIEVEPGTFACGSCATTYVYHARPCARAPRCYSHKRHYVKRHYKHVYAVHRRSDYHIDVYYVWNVAPTPCNSCGGGCYRSSCGSAVYSPSYATGPAYDTATADDAWDY